MSNLSNPGFDLFVIDRDSTAYETGYGHGYEGREFRNPCEGNLPATANYRAGFIKGEAEGRAAYDFPHS